MEWPGTELAAPKSAEQILRIVLDSVSEGIIGVNGEGRTVFASASAAHLLGLSESELIGRPG